MSDETYHRIMEDIRIGNGGGIVGICLARWGEPTLHPRLIDWIKIAKSEGHLFHINTNGVTLDADYIRQLLDSGLDSIKFSFQGIDEKSFEEMRQGASWKNYIYSIQTMYELRGDSPLPYMNIGTTTTYETDEQISAFKGKMGRICDLVTVGKTKLEHIETEKTSLDKSQKDLLSELKHKESLVEKRHIVCPEIFAKLSIDWDGKVSGCCRDYDRFMVVGDLHSNTLGEIFNGEVVTNYRKILSRCGYNEIPFCSRCFDYMSIQS